MLIGDHDMLKVADFGTSRFLEIAAHGTTVIGSPPYMAPEQFQGRAVLASDIYSVGVMMYQMLTGQLPYFSPNPAQIPRSSISRDTPRTPSLPKVASRAAKRSCKNLSPSKTCRAK